MRPCPQGDKKKIKIGKAKLEKPESEDIQRVKCKDYRSYGGCWILHEGILPFKKRCESQCPEPHFQSVGDAVVFLCWLQCVACARQAVKTSLQLLVWVPVLTVWHLRIETWLVFS